MKAFTYTVRIRLDENEWAAQNGVTDERVGQDLRGYLQGALVDTMISECEGTVTVSGPKVQR